jgi:hypothetical protein
MREVLERLPGQAPTSWPPAWEDLAPPSAEAHLALFHAGLFSELDEYERQHLREVIVSTLVAMGRDELAYALVDRALPAERLNSTQPAERLNGAQPAQGEVRHGAA